MALFKKRKKESVAIPLLISMVVTLLLIGIPVFTYYNRIVTEKNGSGSELEENVFTPTEANETALLFSFTPDDRELRPSFLIVRTSAINKSFTFIPVSNDLLCGSEKMSDIFRKGGIIELTKAVEKTFETDIDKYMALNTESLSIICDTIGGVSSFMVPSGLKGLNEGPQSLDADFMIRLISNPKYPEDARTVATANLFADMIAGSSGTRNADMVDIIYNRIINIVETDITSIDYANQKDALDYILRSNQYVSTYRVPAGKTTEQGVVLEKNALKQLKADSGLK